MSGLLPTDTQNPSLETHISRMLEQRLAELHTATPARVVKYDASKQMADVEPFIQRRYIDGSIVALPVISNVPVVHPRTLTAIIHLPVKVGDVVLLVFTERSVDRWKSSDGKSLVDPGDPRKHALSDAFAIPGGYPFSMALPVSDPDAVSISGAVIRLGDDGMAEHPAARGDNVEARLAAIEQGLNTLVQDFTTFITSYSSHLHPTTAPAAPTGPPVVPGTPPSPFTADTSVVESGKVKVD